MTSRVEERSHSVGVVEVQKPSDGAVMVQSGASSLTDDLWSSSDNRKFLFVLLVTHRMNINS